MAIEQSTTQTFSVSGCDIDLSFNRLKVTDPTTRSVLVVDNMDWRKLNKAFADYYAIHGSCSAGIDWFKGSVKHWDFDDLKALGAAVNSAIAQQKAEMEANK